MYESNYVLTVTTIDGEVFVLATFNKYPSKKVLKKSPAA